MVPYPLKKSVRAGFRDEYLRPCDITELWMGGNAESSDAYGCGVWEKSGTEHIFFGLICNQEANKVKTRHAFRRVAFWFIHSTHSVRVSQISLVGREYRWWCYRLSDAGLRSTEKPGFFNIYFVSPDLEKCFPPLHY